MANTAAILHDVLARLEAVEQENRALREQIAMLTHETARVPTASSPPLPVGEPVATLNPLDASLERMSRRWMLRRAAQATAATVVVGTLMQRATPDASANHGDNNLITPRSISTHFIQSSNNDDNFAVLAEADSDTRSAVVGGNSGSASGVSGSSFGGIGVLGTGVIGVRGDVTSAWNGAVEGRNFGDQGYGVVADASGTLSAGALGRNPLGDGVRGEGKTGLHGKSPNGNGVFGEATGGGYGGVFTSARAQLRLLPTGRTGRPTTGMHAVGELYPDRVGTLFICTVAGSPGTWRKVSTTAV